MKIDGAALAKAHAKRKKEMETKAITIAPDTSSDVCMQYMGSFIKAVHDKNPEDAAKYMKAYYNESNKSSSKD